MKNKILCLLLILLQASIKAQVARPVTISGRVCSDRDSIKLIAWFARDIIIGAGTESEKIIIPVNKNGTFSFSTPPITSFARLSIHDAYSGNKLFSQEEQLIAPGDNVQLFANIHDEGEPYYFKGVFFGKGAAKYECIQALRQINTSIPDQTASTTNIIKCYDSLFNSKLTVLNNFKSRLSKEEYNLLLADIDGDLRSSALTAVCGYQFGSYLYRQTGTNDLENKKMNFHQLIAHFSNTADNSEVTPLSIAYRKYLYLKSRNEVACENNGEPITLKPLFEKLCQQYDGLMREKLLAMLLLNFSENYFFFGGIDPDEQLQCLQKAYVMVQSPDLKEKFRSYMKGLVKGAVAYNFTLPLDSSETKKLSLSDLKGKVVLLDVWSYQCTGCMVFTQTFHRKVYPLFKDNPDFVVLSVMLGETSRANYMRRLRNDGNVIYTYPEYTNLFGGKGVADARKMNDTYNITAFPTVLLIDKQGKIYSSTLPVIYGDPRNKELDKNVVKLSDVIKKALAEPN